MTFIANCYNEITIFGLEEDVDNFADAVSYGEIGESLFSFSALYPAPHFLNYVDFLDWRIEHWGSKWDPEVLDLHLESGCLTIICETASSPPLAFLLHASYDFPELRFRISYHEPDARIAGYYEFEKGREVHKHECNSEEVDVILTEHGYSLIESSDIF
jgi:hypothetical protein